MVLTHRLVHNPLKSVHDLPVGRGQMSVCGWPLGRPRSELVHSRKPYPISRYFVWSSSHLLFSSRFSCCTAFTCKSRILGLVGGQLRAVGCLSHQLSHLFYTQSL